MLRHAISILACTIAVLVSATAHAGGYTDPAGRFTVSVPDGWESAKPDNAANLTIVLAKQKTAGAPYEGICLGIYIELTETKSKTQAEINSLIDGKMTTEFWRDALKGSGGDGLKVDATSNREQDGRKINGVIFTGNSNENGATVAAKGKMEVHFIPGSMHTMMCLTEADTWTMASSQFEQIFQSYEPRTPALIASLAGGSGSVLTMFAGNAYDGVARVLSRDTPNLPAAGWVAKAGSLMVDGTGDWQVCERANYQGQCRMVRPGLSSKPGEALIVNSARQMSATGSPAGAVGAALRRSIAEVFRKQLLHR